MEFKTGQIVISKAGRDKGSPLVVTGFDGNSVLVCDGKARPLERPKKKNPRHLQATSGVLSPDAAATNRQLKRALSAQIIK
jgi:ribosomal protein L14E/L6E/L27E